MDLMVTTVFADEEGFNSARTTSSNFTVSSSACLSFPPRVADTSTLQTAHGTLADIPTPDDSSPTVTRVFMDGTLLNRKPRAVIAWCGLSFQRKTADFEWLCRMLRLQPQNAMVPDLPEDIAT